MMLTSDIADAIVRETSQRINKNVNIMNKQGKIISSKDTSRVGTIHNGAIFVLKNKKKVLIDASNVDDWHGTEPGINLPIYFQNEVIGVVGITGNPSEMEDIGEMVKMTAELMVQQTHFYSKIENRKQIKKIMFEELINPSGLLEKIENYKKILNLKFNPDFLLIIVQIEQFNFNNYLLSSELERIFNTKNWISTFLKPKEFTILISNTTSHNVNKNISYVYNVISGYFQNFSIAYSSIFDKLTQFNEFYNKCIIALNLNSLNKKIISFDDVETRFILSQVNQNDAINYYQRVLHSLTKSEIKTLNMFFSNNLHIQNTAEKLFIHRNTMIYRLDKISKKTNLNPKHFQEALTLQIALWFLNEYE